MSSMEKCFTLFYTLLLIKFYEHACTCFIMGKAIAILKEKKDSDRESATAAETR